MAVDQWLLEQHILGNQPSILRFYTWSPFAISLGYHQRQYPEHWQNLTWQGEKIDIVKRPTGGRAVLHQGDLTYAVITSGLGGDRVTLPRSGERLKTYEKICEFLIEGWQNLGIPLHYGIAGRGYIHNPNCFATATGADLVTTNNYKFIGSAQLRRSHAILQHGSMRIWQNPQLCQQVFATEITPDNSINQELTIAEILDALIMAAKNCFSVEFIIEPLSDTEWADIYSKLDISEVQPLIEKKL